MFIFTFRFKDGKIPFPVPGDIRKTITNGAVDTLLNRNYFKRADSADERLDLLARWGLSYEEAYRRQLGLMDEMHKEVMKFDQALKDVKESMDVLQKDHRCSLRLLGSACQSIKVKYFDCLSSLISLDFSAHS